MDIVNIKKTMVVMMSAGMLFELTTVTLQASTDQTPAGKIVLDSKILAMFDGVPYALDGEAFDDMLHVRKAIHILLLGKKHAGGTADGLYMVDGTAYSVTELVHIEAEKGQTPTLKAVLSKAKEDLANIAEPFMNRARGTKHFLLPMLTDWAKKRNRDTTLLLKWHHEEDGKELEVFRQDITSFAHFKTFCDDLVLFMEDLMYNCPKGFNQLLKKKRALKNEQ